MPTIRTERLLLRDWRDEDIEPFSAMFDDPDVMEFLGPSPAPEVIRTVGTRLNAHLQEYGYTFWAVEVPGHADFIGFVGLLNTDFEAHFTPAVEIGWRLAKAHWSKGYATEASKAALEVGFNRVGLNEIVAMTAVSNIRSRAVMERLGMSHSESDNFEHPEVPDGHSLKPHVLYRISRDNWHRRQAR